MKIIFESEEEKTRVLQVFDNILECPFSLGLSGSEDCKIACSDCWAKAINAEVKGD